MVEIGPLVLEKNIFKFSIFRYYLRLEKGEAFHLNKLEYSSKTFGSGELKRGSIF